MAKRTFLCLLATQMFIFQIPDSCRGVQDGNDQRQALPEKLEFSESFEDAVPVIVSGKPLLGAAEK
jgi:hypothetical protein